MTQNLRLNSALLAVIAVVIGIMLTGFGNKGLPAEDSQLPRQHTIEWNAHQLLFIADGRNANIQSFLLGNRAPVPLAKITGEAGDKLVDMKLDEKTGLLWVLGEHSVRAYQAATLTMVKEVPVANAKVARLEIEPEGIKLYNAKGEQIALVPENAKVSASS